MRCGMRDLGVNAVSHDERPANPYMMSTNTGYDMRENYSSRVPAYTANRVES